MRAVCFVGKSCLAVQNIPQGQVTHSADIKIKVMCAVMGDRERDLYRGTLAYQQKTPHVVGTIMAGVIVELGECAERAGFRVGDRVVGSSMVHCGYCYYCLAGLEYACMNLMDAGGACMEYVVWSKEQIIKISDATDFAQACYCILLAIGINAMERVDILPGSDISIVGGEGLGMVLLLLTMRTDAGSVTVVDAVKKRRERARVLGADYVIDPQKKNYWKEAAKITDSKGFNVVFETSKNHELIRPSFYNMGKNGFLVFLSNYATDASFSLNLFHLIQNYLTVLGVCGFSSQQFLRATKVMKKYGVDQLDTTVYSCENANEAMEEYIEGTNILPILAFN